MLSKVVNESVISNLRTEAKFLRAEIYKEQGKDKLAKMQLEAIAKEGGKSANKAKQILTESYSF